jgi:heat-inducible transcriptional repressor
VLLRLVQELAEEQPSERGGLSVRIGAENLHLGLDGTSVVTTGYGGETVLARLGVLGPTRMDYPTTMAAVRAVSRYVSRILAS